MTSPPTVDSWSEFRPVWFLRSGHLQTVVTDLFSGQLAPERAVQHTVTLPDGDQLIVHDDVPSGWAAGDATALLLHGLCGCHRAGYMVRTAAKLNARCVRTFRLDHRGCGAGRGLAKSPYNAARSDDVLAVVNEILRLCPGSRVGIAGFSLSGNILLKLLGEAPDRIPQAVDRAIAVNPPIDLSMCVQAISRAAFGLYDRHFARSLFRTISGSPQWRDDLPIARRRRPPRRVCDFDEEYTSLASGFANAADYYARASASRFLSNVRVPTLIMAAINDPVIPLAMFTQQQLPPSIKLRIERHGGHMGYMGRSSGDADWRWMDWRVVDWLTSS